MNNIPQKSLSFYEKEQEILPRQVKTFLFTAVGTVVFLGASVVVIKLASIMVKDIKNMGV